MDLDLDPNAVSFNGRAGRKRGIKNQSRPQADTRTLMNCPFGPAGAGGYRAPVTTLIGAVQRAAKWQSARSEPLISRRPIGPLFSPRPTWIAFGD